MFHVHLERQRSLGNELPWINLVLWSWEGRKEWMLYGPLEVSSLTYISELKSAAISGTSGLRVSLGKKWSLFWKILWQSSEGEDKTQREVSANGRQLNQQPLMCMGIWRCGDLERRDQQEGERKKIGRRWKLRRNAGCGVTKYFLRTDF